MNRAFTRYQKLPSIESPLVSLNRSAELNSAVSQTCSLRHAEHTQVAGPFGPPAECNSAIQQVANLRYGVGGDGKHLEIKSSAHES